MRGIQVLFAVTLGFVSTVFSTSLKTSFLYLLALKHDTSVDTWYAAMYLSLVVPEFLSLMRVLWSNSYLYKDEIVKWPPYKIILLGIVTTLLESAALAFFTLQVAPQLPGYLILPVLNVLLFLQVIMDQWKRPKGVHSVIVHSLTASTYLTRIIHTTLATIGVVIFLFCVAFVMVPIFKDILTPILIFPTMLVLSIVWCQPLRSCIYQAEGHCETVRYNMTSLMILVRVLSLTGFSICVIPMGGEIGLQDAAAELWRGICSFAEDSTLVSVLAVHCCAGLLTYTLTRLSAYYTTTWSGILVPSILSTVLTSVVYIANCSGEFYVKLDEKVCTMTKINVIMSGSVVLLWFLPVLIVRRYYFIPADTLFKPEPENFITIGYSGVYFDQHCFLNYYPCPVYQSDRTLTGNDQTRVFMCTTMYRESNYEMEQLLRSLDKVNKSTRLKEKKVYFEAHIFMDNGSDDLNLNEFAVQLLDLVEHSFPVGSSDNDVYRTPYGLQIAYKLPGNMPFVIHLKDPKCIKSKKRWSQVMYLNYILQYRLKRTKSKGIRLRKVRQSMYSRMQYSIGSIWSVRDTGNMKVNPTYVPDSNEPIYPRWVTQCSSSTLNWIVLPDFINKLGTSNEYQQVSWRSSREAPVDLSEAGLISSNERTYILATDADMQFCDLSVLELVETCNSDLRLGAACGRTHPTGKKNHPIVWFQLFEYAKDFWMAKSTQNIIGSVMCCPGCFSLYRASAVAEVIQEYSKPTSTPGQVFIKDMGEDRWMCSLMMMKGWRLKYSYSSKNTTFCPDTMDDFLIQRRRWILSDLSNTLLVFRNLPHLIRNNRCFSLASVTLLLQLIVLVLAAPASTIVVFSIGMEMLTELRFYVTAIVVSVLVLLYAYMCIRVSSQKQLLLTKVSTVLLGLVMSVVFLWVACIILRDFITGVQANSVQLSDHYILVSIICAYVYAALLHPTESWVFLNGIFYVFFFPSMHILLPIYAISNMVDQSWGTREGTTSEPSIFGNCLKIGIRGWKHQPDETSEEKTKTKRREVSVDQLKVMRLEEQYFWTQILNKFLGTEVNNGLTKDKLVDGIRSLRFTVLTSLFIFNLLWMIAFCCFYEYTVRSEDVLKGYGVVNGIIFGFLLFMQLLGMTVYRVSNAVYRLGKILFRDEKPHWVTKKTD